MYLKIGRFFYCFKEWLFSWHDSHAKSNSVDDEHNQSADFDYGHTITSFGLQSFSQTGEMLLQLHKSLLVINCFSFEASLFTAGSLVLPVSLHPQTVAGASKIHRLGTTLLLWSSIGSLLGNRLFPVCFLMKTVAVTTKIHRLEQRFSFEASIESLHGILFVSGHSINGTSP